MRAGSDPIIRCGSGSLGPATAVVMADWLRQQQTSLPAAATSHHRQQTLAPPPIVNASLRLREEVLAHRPPGWDTHGVIHGREMGWLDCPQETVGCHSNPG